jgi:hypothetical protein
MTVPAGSASSSTRGGLAATSLALALWCVLVTAAWRLGLDHRATWKLRAAPLAGFVDRQVTLATLAALVVGLATVAVLPRWAGQVRWRWLLVGTAMLAVAWGAVLGLSRPTSSLDRGLAHRHEYPAVVPFVDEMGVGEFVRTFTADEALRRYPIHVQGHPLGAALVFVGLDRVGLGGSSWAALSVVLLAATATPAVLLAVREVAGEVAARRLAPFLILSPAAIWVVASADGAFMAVGAWSVALLVLASSPERSARNAAGLSMLAGAVAGVGINLSYGLVLVPLIGAMVAVARRRPALVGWAALGGAGVVAAVAAGGFWWLDGLDATRVRYAAGIAAQRDRGYFTLLGNPAALAVALGPALAVAVARVRDRRLWLLGAGALGAVALANISGLSKAEVERIWLPFVPWITVLAAGLPALGAVVGARADGVEGSARAPADPVRWPPLAVGLLALQVVTAVAVESLVKTPW